MIPRLLSPRTRLTLPNDADKRCGTGTAVDSHRGQEKTTCRGRWSIPVSTAFRAVETAVLHVHSGDDVSDCTSRAQRLAASTEKATAEYLTLRLNRCV